MIYSQIWLNLPRDDHTMFSMSSYAWLPLRLHNEIPHKSHRGPVTLFKHNEPSKSDSFKTRYAEVLGGSPGGQIINTKTKGIAVLPSSWPIPFSSSQQHTHSPWQNWSGSYVTTDNLGSCIVCGNFLCPYLSASTALRSEICFLGTLVIASACPNLSLKFCSKSPSLCHWQKV